jgi:hypothetical protein
MPLDDAWNPAAEQVDDHQLLPLIDIFVTAERPWSAIDRGGVAVVAKAIEDGTYVVLVAGR